MNLVTQLRFADGYRPRTRPRTPETRLGQFDWLTSFDNWLWGSSPATPNAPTVAPTGGTDVSLWDAVKCSDFGACGSQIADMNSGPASVVSNCIAAYGADSPACMNAQQLASWSAAQTPGMVAALNNQPGAGFQLPTWAWVALAVGAVLAIQKL